MCTGLLVQWHDSCFGCRRSWVQFPDKPIVLLIFYFYGFRALSTMGRPHWDGERQQDHGLLTGVYQKYRCVNSGRSPLSFFIILSTVLQCLEKLFDVYMKPIVDFIKENTKLAIMLQIHILTCTHICKHLQRLTYTVCIQVCTHSVCPQLHAQNYSMNELSSVHTLCQGYSI